jgi:hypothetical protein
MEDSFRTEQDLQKLIGQYESLRLDFKASALLNSQPPDRIVKQLTEDVSAFANTEGGVIVIGIKESKNGRKSVGSAIDEGVDPAIMPPERLEQLITANISPQILGLVVRPIQLSGVKSGRVAYVIFVPKGVTAYQARREHKYFGRTEFAAIPLEDYVIRLLMNRGRSARAIIELDEVQHFSAETDFERRRMALEADEKEGMIIRTERRAELEAPRRESDTLEFKVGVRNDGPVTIRDCALLVAFRTIDSVRVGCSSLKNGPLLFHFSGQNRSTTKIAQVAFGGVSEERQTEAVLYPQQVAVFPGVRLSVDVPASTG